MAGTGSGSKGTPIKDGNGALAKKFALEVMRILLPVLIALVVGYFGRQQSLEQEIVILKQKIEFIQKKQDEDSQKINGAVIDIGVVKSDVANMNGKLDGLGLRSREFRGLDVPDGKEK